jgi:hypothetical protein
MKLNKQLKTKIISLHCLMCGKQFYRCKDGIKCNVPGIRTKSSINCSKKCSLSYTSYRRTGKK